MASFSSSILDIVNDYEDNTEKKFFEDMKEFPCLFDITNCKFDCGNERYTGIIICAPDLSRNKWEALEEDLKYDNEDSEFDNAVWKENLLTFVLTELGLLKDALRLNGEIKKKHGMNNIITLANAAFLFHRTGHFGKACEIIEDLRKLKSDRQFFHLKIEAVIELGYAFRKFGGAQNLRCAISLLEFSLSVHKNDERLQFMLAMVYRRCTHFNIYTADPININRHDCALKAATDLFKLGCSAKHKAIRAAAFIELAYCKYNDDTNKGKYGTDEQNILSREEWFQIVQGRTWRELCKEAIIISGDNPTEKVFKMAGQLYRYSDTDEDLEKSEELLLKAIKIKSSNRAHHQLGLTYRKMAVIFQKKRIQSRKVQQKYRKGAGNRHCGRQDWPHKNGRYFPATRCTVYADGYNQNPEYFNDKTRPKSEYKNQKLNIPQGNVQYNREAEIDEGFKMLPSPPPDNSPHSLGSHLKYITRVPDNFLMHFSKDNPFVEKAIAQFKRAAEVSHYQNRPAVYDLAYILAQTERYDESKQMCKTIISERSGPKGTIINFPVYLVNAFNLYGVCCEKQAEIIESDSGIDNAQKHKTDLLIESEKNLTLAVRLASQLANIPELSLCATDLWNAFRELKRKFTFHGQKESKEKLFKLCEFICDYKYLQAVDEIIRQDPTELDKMEVIEQCLRRYLKMRAFDSALLFRDLINLRPAIKANLLKSDVYKQLMLEVAEGKLDEEFLQVGSEVYHPDPIWKQLFTDKFQTAGTRKKYEIVIAEDIDDDFEPKWEMLSNIISENLKLALQQTFDLNTVFLHKEFLPGTLCLAEPLQILSNASVAIFILTSPCLSFSSLESDMASLSISGTAHSVAESAAVNEERNDECTSDGVTSGYPHESENSVSSFYETIINTSISNCLHNVGATHVVLVAPDSLEFRDLPQAVRSLPRLVLSPSEIETLAASTPLGNLNEQFVNLMKKVFRFIVGKY